MQVFGIWGKNISLTAIASYTPIYEVEISNDGNPMEQNKVDVKLLYWETFLPAYI